MAVFTNGSLLNEKKINYLEEILDSLDFIQVSLDGSNEEIFYSQRRTRGFDNIIHNLDLLGKSSIITRVNMTATKYNIDDIVNVYSLCNKLCVDTFSLSYVYGLNKGKSLYKSHEVEKYIEQICNCIMLEDDYTTMFKPFIPVEFYMKIKDKKSINTTLGFRDYTSFLYRFTNANGDMYPDVS